MAVRPARAVALSRAQPNAFARQLFDGLPRRYDVLEAVLSFGQNHRWRTAMVDAVVTAPSPHGGSSTSPAAPGWSARRSSSAGDAASSGIDQSAAMLGGGAGEGRRLDPTRRADRAGRGRGRVAPLRRRRVRPPHLHLPAALRRRPGRDPARAGPGGEARRARSPASSSACRRGIWLPPGASTPGSACRPLGRLDARAGARRGASSGRASKASTAPIRWRPGRAVARGGDRRSQVRRMSLGGGVVIWGTVGGRARRPRPAFYALAPGGARDVVDVLSPALHRLARRQRRARRRRRRVTSTRSASPPRSPPSSSPSGSAPTPSTS